MATSLLQQPNLRLLTLTGPGGIGKTRLAVEVAAVSGVGFPDGVPFVSLAPIRAPSMVLPAIAAALGLQDLDASGIEDRLATFLGTSSILLVVDNFEHVLDAAPALTRLISRCPCLKVVVTSRSVLRVEGEHTIPVPPLVLPQSKSAMTYEDWLRVPVIRLFLERARAVSPSLTWTLQDVLCIAGICARLDGLPLAVELAATRVRHFTLAEIRDRLDERLPLLIGGSRDHPSRLQTMRNAIAWSHDLLTPDVQVLFRRLAVFTGGFSLQAAYCVGREGMLDPNADEQVLASNVFDSLTTLIDTSLLQTELRADGVARYWMLETIREFALERLETSGEVALTRRAHAAYFLALAERYELTDLLPAGNQILEVLEAERSNLRAALSWLQDSGDAGLLTRLTVALGRYWADQGYYQEGGAWLERVVVPESTATNAERSKALVHLGMMDAFQWGNQDAETRLTEGLVGCRAVGATFHAAIALILLGWLVNQRGDHERGTTLLAEAITVANDLADPRLAEILVGWALANLAEIARMRGGQALAAERLEAALSHHRTAGFSGGMILALKDLGELARDQGEPLRAIEWYREALRLVRGSPGTRVVTELIEALGIAAIAVGQAERGLRLLGATEAQRERIGLRFRLSMTKAALDLALAAARAALGASAFDAAWTAGRTLQPAQAVAEALDPFVLPTIAVSASLTSRETEILTLLAAGLTGPDTAAALFISARTVENHVAHILAKLGVRTRTGAVSAAIAAGLVAADPSVSSKP